MSAWSDAHAELVRKDWLAGLSASQIARKVNRTRNAVIGIVHRNGWQKGARQAPAAPRAAPSAAKHQFETLKAAAIQEAEAQAVRVRAQRAAEAEAAAARTRAQLAAEAQSSAEAANRRLAMIRDAAIRHGLLRTRPEGGQVVTLSGCKWIGTQGPCGAPVKPGKPFCAAHSAAAYVPGSASTRSVKKLQRSTPNDGWSQAAPEGRDYEELDGRLR